MRTTALVTLLAFCCACVTRHTIAPDDIRKLDGYSPAQRFTGPLEVHEEGPPPHLRAELLPPGTLRLRDRDHQGEWFDLDPESTLRIEGLKGESLEGKLRAANISDEKLVGQFTDSPAFQIPLVDIESIKAEKFSPGRTVLAVVGVVALVFVGGLLAIAAGCSGRTSGDHPCFE